MLAEPDIATYSPAAASTRSRILETATELFRTIGYTKTTVADIARALKMSPANVYRFFASKAAINEAIAAGHFAEIEGRITAIARAERPAAERLHEIFVTMFEQTKGRYVAEAKVHDMIAAAMEEQWPAIQAHLERLKGLIDEVLLSGTRNGEFVIDDPELALQGTFNTLAPFCHPQMVCQCLLESGETRVRQSAAFVVATLTRRGI